MGRREGENSLPLQIFPEKVPNFAIVYGKCRENLLYMLLAFSMHFAQHCYLTKGSLNFVDIMSSNSDLLVNETQCGHKQM